MAGEPLLSLAGVGRCVRRGGTAERLLADVGLEVWPGELVSIVAMRSQGKTTLLEIAAGLQRPDSGVVRFAGRDLASVGDSEHARLLREEIGLVGQAGPLIDLEIAHYVAGPLLVSRRRAREQGVSVDAVTALERVGMASRAEQRWGELSCWDRALVEIAQGIAGGPRLLLVDDVCDGLGMREAAHVTRLLRSLAQEDGMAVLMAVSDGESAAGAHRVLRLARGSLRGLSAPPRERAEFTAYSDAVAGDGRG